MQSPPDPAAETQRQLRERARDFDQSDLVVGRFFGEADSLVLRCDRGSLDYGSIRVALPIDPRASARKRAANPSARWSGQPEREV